ncbi:hypothetical protein GF412_04450 [Candidatus Micrarchaeota archaeon]|nr:hypothetical protein [Candidatus Micrarchaeota archaeon]MBD3418202.1 hypothetical protein [Candidatus Micrarchaeota archaeon]
MLDVVSNLWQQWEMIAVLAISLAIVFAALVYMLGQFLNNDKMIAFAKLELVEAFYSAALIVVVLLVLATATEAAASLIKGVYPDPGLGAQICGPTFDPYFNDFENQFPCHMRMARYYLDTLYSEGKLFNYELLSIHMWYSFFQNIGVSADFHEHTSGSVNYSPLGSAFSLPSSIYSYMFEFGMKSMVIVRFQQFFLNFINYSLYPVLVMLGLILRTFPFSRRLGGQLMAIGISLFFIFPMFYVLGAIIFKNVAMQSPYYDSSQPDPSKRMPEVITSLDFDPEEFYGKVGFVEEDSIVSGEVPGQDMPDDNEKYLTEELYPETVNYCQQTSDFGEADAADLLSDWFDMFLYSIDFTGQIVDDDGYIDSLIGPGGVIDATARFVFFSMFFGLLSVFSTVGAIRSLSPIFGGDIELAGLTHLI